MASKSMGLFAVAALVGASGCSDGCFGDRYTRVRPAPVGAVAADGECAYDETPVCGSDGIDYANACRAEKEGRTHVAHAGLCTGRDHRGDPDEPPAICTQLHGPACLKDGTTCWANPACTGKDIRVKIAHWGICDGFDVRPGLETDTQWPSCRP